MNEIVLTGEPLWHTCRECGEIFDLMKLPVQHGRIYCPYCYVPIGMIRICEGEGITNGK